MAATLREEAVAGLQVTVSVAPTLDRIPHDVYLLEVALAGGREPGVRGFDEAPILGDLEPLLAAVGSSPQWVVDVSRTHRSDEGAGGRARISLLLVASGTAALSTMSDLTGAVQDAFARIGARAAPSAARVDHSHDAALVEARAAVVRLYPDIDSAHDLGLTDEEHHASEGSWSMGLVLPGVARFRVRVGLVPAVPHSVHVRRMPVGEVVDSVGT